MKTVTMVVLTSTVLWGAALSAQGPGPRPGGGFPGPGPGAFGRGMDVLGVEPLELAEPVVGAPYSADTVTEIVQVLADGNRIEQRTTGSVARDGQGRVRREQTLAGFGTPGPAGTVRIVTIVHPAGRQQYRLDEARKTAWLLRLPPPPPRRDPAGSPPPMPPSATFRTEQLTPMQVDGIRAEGTRIVMVLPAGAFGNERPIDVTSERWYSPELRIVLSTRRVDPRVGEVTFRLENIMRVEPAAELFDVPADYTVRPEQRFPMPPSPR